MYTVLSVVCPITVVRVLIFRSAEAKAEKQIRTSTREKQRNRRITAGLLENDVDTLPNNKAVRGNSKQLLAQVAARNCLLTKGTLLFVRNGQFHIEFLIVRLVTQRAPSPRSGRFELDVSPQNASLGALLKVFVERIKRHLPRIWLTVPCPTPIDGDHGCQLVAGHDLQAHLPQRGIVATMMPDLVEHRAVQQVLCCDCLAFGQTIVLRPVSLVPRLPVAHLRVAREQQDALALRQLNGKRQTGVIGRRVKLQSQNLAGVE